MKDHRRITKIIGCLLSIYLAVADSDCEPLAVPIGGNITFPIDPDTNSGKEIDVSVSLNGTLIAQLACTVTCELDITKPGIPVVYENGSLIKMNASRLDEGIYTFRYLGSSLKKDKTMKCFNVTVVGTISPDPPSIRPAVGISHKEIIAGVTITAAILALIFVIYCCQKKKRNNSNADSGAGDTGVDIPLNPISNQA